MKPQSTNSSINRDYVFKAASPLPEKVPYPLLIEAIDCACKRYIFSQSGEDGNPHNYDHSTLWLLHIYHGWCRQVWTEMFLEEYLSLRIVLWSSCSGKKVAVKCFKMFCWNVFVKEYLSLRLVLWSSCGGKEVAGPELGETAFRLLESHLGVENQDQDHDQITTIRSRSWAQS